jgi:hypothetical protein
LPDAVHPEGSDTTRPWLPTPHETEGAGYRRPKSLDVRWVEGFTAIRKSNKQIGVTRSGRSHGLTGACDVGLDNPR